MKTTFISIIYFSFAYISAQTSNINIDGNSSIILLDNNSICADEITVETGSSFTAEYYGNVLEGNCSTIITPVGRGGITLPVELFDIENLPSHFMIEPAYPNPFNPSTTIRYGIPTTQVVDISIYDLRGRLISNLFRSEQPAGWYEITWNGQINDGSIASVGMYIYQIKAGQEIKTSKISLVK